MDTIIKLLEAVFQSEGTMVLPISICIVLGMIAYNKWLKPFFGRFSFSIDTVMDNNKLLKEHTAEGTIEITNKITKQLETQQNDINDLKHMIKSLKNCGDTNDKDVNAKLQDIIIMLNKISIHTEISNLGLRGIK